MLSLPFRDPRLAPYLEGDVRDVLVRLGVFEPRLLLEKLRPALRPDGLMLISLPDCWRLRKWRNRQAPLALLGRRKLVSMVYPLEHVNSFDAGSVTRLAQSVGLQRLRAGPTQSRVADHIYVIARSAATKQS